MLLKVAKLQLFSLGPCCQVNRVTQEKLKKPKSRYGPCPFPLTWSLLLKDLSFIDVCFTAAGVVPCGGPKTSSRTSSTVQIIFFFGPFRSAREF